MRTILFVGAMALQGCVFVYPNCRVARDKAQGWAYPGDPDMERAMREADPCYGLGGEECRRKLR